MVLTLHGILVKVPCLETKPSFWFNQAVAQQTKLTVVVVSNMGIFGRRNGGCKGYVLWSGHLAIIGKQATNKKRCKVAAFKSIFKSVSHFSMFTVYELPNLRPDKVELLRAFLIHSIGQIPRYRTAKHFCNLIENSCLMCANSFSTKDTNDKQCDEQNESEADLHNLHRIWASSDEPSKQAKFSRTHDFTIDRESCDGGTMVKLRRDTEALGILYECTENPR